MTTAGREVGSIADRDEKTAVTMAVVDLRQRSNKGFKAMDHDRARNADGDGNI